MLEGINIIYLVSSHLVLEPGGIRVRDALDFEKEHAYYLTVKASDAGVRPLSDTTMVNIQVTDVNDNSPVFSQDIYNSEVIEAARVGDSVVQVCSGFIP